MAGHAVASIRPGISLVKARLKPAVVNARLLSYSSLHSPLCVSQEIIYASSLGLVTGAIWKARGFPARLSSSFATYKARTLARARLRGTVPAAGC